MIKLKDLLMENIDEGIRDPGILKCVFSAGGPGSGKSRVVSDIFGIAKNLTLSSTGLKLVNSDITFEKLLTKNDIDSDLTKLPPDEFKKITSTEPDSLRSKAKATQQSLLSQYIKGRLGIIIDGTGEDFKKIKDKKELFEGLGYDCMMVFVNTSLESALQRNAKRKRKIPEDIVKQLWQNAQNNIGKYQALFGKNFVIVDNSGDFHIHTSVKKAVNAFLAEPTKNRKGIEWKSKQI